MPRLAHILDVWRKEDPPTNKKLPVWIGIPEFLAELGRDRDAIELVKLVGNLAYFF